MAVFGPRLRAASLFLYQDLGLEKRAHVVHILIGNTHFDGFDAFIPCGGIEIHAVAAGVQVRSAVLAFIGDLNLIHHLDFCRTVVAARHQDEFCLSASATPGAISPGMITTPCRSPCNKSPGFTTSPPTRTGPPKSTRWT